MNKYIASVIVLEGQSLLDTEKTPGVVAFVMLCDLLNERPTPTICDVL